MNPIRMLAIVAAGVLVIGPSIGVSGQEPAPAHIFFFCLGEL